MTPNPGVKLRTTAEERAAHFARSAMAETATVPAGLINGLAADIETLIAALVAEKRAHALFAEKFGHEDEAEDLRAEADADRHDSHVLCCDGAGCDKARVPHTLWCDDHQPPGPLIHYQAFAAPPWLADAAEALGEVRPYDGAPKALNWTQVIEAIHDLREQRDALTAEVAALRGGGWALARTATKETP